MKSEDPGPGRIMGHTQTASAEAYCPTCEQSFPSTVGSCPDDGTKLVQFEPQSDDLVGTVLDDRFEIRGRLGQGGMGTVYHGWQSSVGRNVAVKVIDARLSRHRPLAKRFLREARLSSRLSQANIVVCHDFGHSNQGVLYIVMEMVVGKTLHKLLADGGAMPIDRIVGISLQLCDALDAAHRLDIVHRDLKPANIMILDEPAGRDVVKVLDFGLAKSLVGDDTTNITDSNAVMGTPKYMSPEQISGEAPVDARSDLYSLGCIMYEMIAGRAPFLGSSTNLLLARHMADDPEPLDEGVGPLSSLVHALLAKSPNDRPQSAAEVREAVLAERAYTPAPMSTRRLRSNGSDADANVATLAGASRRSNSSPDIGATRAGALSPRRLLVPAIGVALVAAIAVALLVRPWQTRGAGEQRGDDVGETAAPLEPEAVAFESPRGADTDETRPVAIATHTEPDAMSSEPATIELTLRSKPTARVTVDGVDAGSTPTTYSRKAGTDPVEIVFRKTGYDTERRKVTPSRDEVVDVALRRTAVRRNDTSRDPKPPGPDPDAPPDIDFKLPDK